MVLSTACGGGTTNEPTTEPIASTEPEPVDDGIRVEEGLLPPMPVAVTSFGSAVHDGYVYVLGGYHGEPHHYTREGQSRSLTRISVDGASGWERVSMMEAGLQGLALVSVGGDLCRIGGSRVFNAEGEETDMRSVDETACYSVAEGAWRTMPPLPEARSSHEAWVIGDTVYVAGGWRVGPEGPAAAEWSDEVFALDHASGTWRRIEAPFRRRAVGVAAAGGQLVVLGGLTPESETSRRVDVFDPAHGTWSRGPDFPTDAFGVAAATVGDAVVASARDGVVYRWAVGQDAWTPVASLAFPRFFHRLMTTDGGLIALGGIGGMNTDGRTRHVERVRLEERAPLVRFSLPYPGAAKNRQGVFVHGDFVYLFGGNTSLEQHDFEPENFVAEGWRLHLPSMTWERVADYPARRQTMQTVSLEAQGIAVGGFGHDGTAAITHPQAFAFDFEHESWSERGGLPMGRTQFGLVENDGRLFVFGGLNYDPSREGEAAFDHVTTTLATAPGALEGAFEPIDADLPAPRRAFAGARMGEHYYIVGGMRAGFDLVDDCVRYAFATQTYEPIACPSRTRLSGALVNMGERLLLVAGSVVEDGSMSADRSIEAYDPASNTWSVLVDELPFDTRHVNVARYRDRLLLLSTHRTDGRAEVALVDPG
ncbi:MAG: Kelch repeat-containing protein [Sandaracinaceae bacterium]